VSIRRVIIRMAAFRKKHDLFAEFV